MRLIKQYILLFFLTGLTPAYAQPVHTRAPFGNPNEDSTRVIGISGSLVSMGFVDNITIGIHLELFGLAEMVVHGYEGETMDSAVYAKIKNTRASKRIYGLNLSGFGFFNRESDMNGISINGLVTVTRKSTGASISGWMNYSKVMYGIQLAGLANSADILYGLQASVIINNTDYRSAGIQLGILNKAIEHRGLQIGIYNRAKKLRGLQVGLWNKNEKRSFPLINW